MLWKIWLAKWARGNTGRIYYQHQQTPNQTDPINQLHRAHQTVVFRLRTHHAPLNAHLHRIKKEHPAKCVYCPDSDETVKHFLFHCPLYDNITSRLLTAQPNIHNTLYGSTSQLQRTATYNKIVPNVCSIQFVLPFYVFCFVFFAFLLIRVIFIEGVFLPWCCRAGWCYSSV